MELLESVNVKIGDKEYPVKKSVRALMQFEVITGHPLNKIETMGDIVAIFYCMFKAGGNNLTYDQFLDLIDDKPECINAFFDSVLSKHSDGEKKTESR